jgi:all-trans-retinol 13,14-reductase
VGGGSRIAEAILPVIRGAGGDVITNAEVGSILVEGGKAVGVRLVDGNELRALVVISDAGAHTTYCRLVPEEIRSRAGLAALVGRQPLSSAHVALYVGLRRTAAELGITKTHLWIYPGPDHSGDLERFFADPQAPLPVAFIGCPSAKDPDFEHRHPGHAAIEVLTLVPYTWFEKWEDPAARGTEYEELKARLQERLLQVLCRHCPDVRGQTDTVELSTPLTTKDLTGHPRGAMYGLAATPSFFAERALRPRTPLRGLYLTGCDAATLGVSGSLIGGVLCASAVLGRDLRRAVAKHAA